MGFRVCAPYVASVCILLKTVCEHFPYVFPKVGSIQFIWIWIIFLIWCRSNDGLNIRLFNLLFLRHSPWLLFNILGILGSVDFVLSGLFKSKVYTSSPQSYIRAKMAALTPEIMGEIAAVFWLASYWKSDPDSHVLNKNKIWIFICTFRTYR